MRSKSLPRLIFEPLCLAIALAFAVRALLFQIYSIPSSSMEPTLRPGDQIIVTPYRFPFSASGPKSGDVIVFRSPANTGETVVKRVIGTPGDHVEVKDGRVRLRGQTLFEPYLLEQASTTGLPSLVVPAAGYFVMGDNRRSSSDSRTWGFVPRDMVLGQARLVLWSATGRSARAEAFASTPLAPAARWAPARRLFLPIR
ncbi:MAG TPA: signal peptidase I [Thermoanaerobaculia bacterium]|nr:signal peptidase I [Thermoanaerobaculia bacterium]